MSNPKLILLQGQFKFSPKLTNQQVNDNQRYHQYTDFILNIDTITCNSFLKMFQNEDIAFRDVKYIIQTFRGRNFKYHGEILGLLEDNNKFKKVKFVIKNGRIKHEDCEFRLVKQGNPRGPYNKKQPQQQPQPQQLQQQVEKTNISTQTVKSISNPKHRVQKADATTQTTRVAIPPLSPSSTRSPSPSPPPPRSQSPTPPRSQSPTPPSKQPEGYNEFDKYRRILNEKLNDSAIVNCLNPNRFIYNDTILAYLCLLYVNIEDEEKKTIGLTNDEFMKLLLRYPNNLHIAQHHPLGILGHKITDFKYFVFPFDIFSFTDKRIKHAVLMVIDNDDQKIYIYDSDNPKRENHYQEEYKAIRKFMTYQKIKGAYKLEIPKVPQQETIDDCGVFVMEFARNLFINRRPGSFSQANIPSIRKRIKEELQNKRLSIISVKK